MPATKPTNRSGLRLRGKPRFGLRTLLIAISLFAVCFAVEARYRQQAQEVAWIRELGGSVVLEPIAPHWLGNLVGQEHFVRIQSVDLHLTRRYAKPLTDEDLKRLGRLTNIEGLYLGGYIEQSFFDTRYVSKSAITDAGLEHLQNLTELRQLYLVVPDVTDAGLEHLKGLTNLQELHILSEHVTDAALDDLRRAMPQLRIYRFNGESLNL